jgi:hypothetical protein
VSAQYDQPGQSDATEVTVFVYGALMGRLAGGASGYVKDYRVAFVAQGLPWIEPAFASLEPMPGARADGVVVTVPAAEWARWRRREAGYHEVEITAFARGRELRCRSLRIGPRFRGTERKPSARYMHLLHSAAVDKGLPQATCVRYAELCRQGPRLTRKLQALLTLLAPLVPYLGFWGTLAVFLAGVVGVAAAAATAVWYVATLSV